MSTCSGGDDGGGGDDGFPSRGAGPGAGAGAQQSALQDAIHSIAQTVGQMQETMMTMIRKMERTDETVRGVERRLTQQGEMVAKIDSRMSELDRSLHEAKAQPDDGRASPHNERGLVSSDGRPSLQNAHRPGYSDGRATSQNELRPGCECPPTLCHAQRSSPSLPHTSDSRAQPSFKCDTQAPVPFQSCHNEPRIANPKAQSSSQSLYRPPLPSPQRRALPDTGQPPPPSTFQLSPSIRRSISSSTGLDGYRSLREARPPSLDVGHEPPQEQKYRHSDCSQSWRGDFILQKNRSKSPNDSCSASPRGHPSSPLETRCTSPHDRSSLSSQESSLRSQGDYCWRTQCEYRSLPPDTDPHDCRSETQEQPTHTLDDFRSPTKSVGGPTRRLNSSDSSEDDRSSRGKRSDSDDDYQSATSRDDRRSKSIEDDYSVPRSRHLQGHVLGEHAPARTERGRPRLQPAREPRLQAPTGGQRGSASRPPCKPLDARRLPTPPPLRRSPVGIAKY